ncbi:hypothetical protein WEN_01135 [Mycoplasma wenyonii str. Massachusetts]|uniref:Restriction endonuclease type II NgoFVII C-terminal B3-like DNA-binding domain-containing protein n=1 Tax=Mycoplasma wenyonii (strain Massachusetts) TaxID=1197325 RepID=I6YAN8_MYCWM|nr:hypothetical protein [Mycoplasma wenyonii]AFN65026.1 hypothetical protein WEN_01135 [Mycoplasma wenyonii str. Massachusetts]
MTGCKVDSWGGGKLNQKKKLFCLITDNGRFGKACFSGRGKKIKWLNTFKDEDMIDGWIKNRLIGCDLIEEFWYSYEDTEKFGVVTK